MWLPNSAAVAAGVAGGSEERAATTVGVESEAAERVNTAEVQLRGVALGILYREHAGSVGSFLRGRGVDVEEINLVVNLRVSTAIKLHSDTR